MSADDLHRGWLTHTHTDWSTVRMRLAGMTACWTDDQGLHITAADNLPLEPPSTCTHLWAWGDRHVHVRIDGGRHHLAELHSQPPVGGEAVTVRVRHETSLTFRSVTGENAAIRLADDTDPLLMGGRASAHVIVEGPRLVFLST